MSNKSFSLLLILLLPLCQIRAQTGTISVGPPLTCGLTTFTCPNISGCCTIAGCCGSGCCAIGYTCINEGTSDEACCDSFDPTQCGTVPLPSSTPDSGGGTSGSNQCTALQACPALTEDGVGWSCFFGQTCGFSYRACNPCPYLGSGGGSAATSSYEGSSPTSSGSSDESSPTSSGSSDGSEPSPSGSSSGSTSNSDTPKNSGVRSRDGKFGWWWLAVVGLGGIFGMAA